MFLKWLRKAPKRVYSPPKREYSLNPFALKGAPPPLSDAVKSDIKSQIRSLPDVPKNERNFAVEEAIICVQSGGDLARLVWALGEIGVDKKRAATIARGVNRRAGALQDVERQSALGFTEAIWKYSGSPCFRGCLPDDKADELDTLHRNANNFRFPINKGLLVGSAYTRPGLDWGCKCTSTPIFPELDD